MIFHKLSNSKSLNYVNNIVSDVPGCSGVERELWV